MFTNSKITKSVRLALLFGAASSAMISPSVVYAQEEAPAAEQEIERIAVTGSRIRRPGAVSASPIMSMGAEEIEMIQTPQIEEVLRNLPATIPGDGASVNNGTAGAATVNLRALGTQRTLVLMNGRRMIPFNFNGIVDTASVPVSLIESVDVVTGGASAVYGSDAIAGAVNFVMKNNFEGVEFSFNHSETEESDGETDNISLTLGSSLDEGRGNVALAMNWTDRKPVMLGDRPLGVLGIATASGGGYQSYLDGDGPVPPHQNCGGPDVTTFESGGGSTTAIPTRFAIVGAGVNGQFREDRTIGDDCSRFNFNPYNFYQTPQERYGATAIAHYDISDDHRVYTTAQFNNTQVKQQIAPSGTFGSTFMLPLANPFIGDQALGWILDNANQARVDGLLNGGVENWQDINGNGVVDTEDYLQVQLRRRTLELGPRSTNYETALFQLVAGVEGVLYEDWEYDVSFQYGESNRTNISAGYTNVSNIQKALDTTDGVNCKSGESACVPIDLFGGFGTITPEAAAFSSATALIKQEYSQEVITASVNGPVEFIEIPWAGMPLTVSFGYEHRKEVGETIPDECLKEAPTSCLGGAGGNTLPIKGGFKVSEYFVEGVLPVFDGQTMAESLDIEFAYRSADYDSVGSNNTWKLGFSWRPVDSLLVRVMQQEATRAPNVGEIASPAVTGLSNALIDPCSVANAANIDANLRQLCISTGMTDAQVGKVQDVISGQVNAFQGTNPEQLPEAEEAETFTAGFVYTNEDLLDLELTVDYYDIEVDNTIGTFTAQQTMDACYTYGITSECEKINRIGGDLTIAGSGIETYTTNLSYRKAEGVEVGIHFAVGMEDWGEMRFATNLNHYMSNERQSSSVLPVIDCLGMYGNNCSPTPETTWNQRVTWNLDDFTMSLLWRHSSAVDMEEVQAAGSFEAFRSIDAYDYFDLFASYNLGEHTKLTFGIDNVTDEDAPVVGGEAGSTAFNSGNTFPSSYSPLGRIFKAGVKFTF
ncbi:TonB-dependent receptor [Thalassotalea sp. M1531]|uniref:TonB-dependent receptor n=1 Tax=Thalassotalea algicola TaxID=2716224 RepID=A0A7Y0LF62_9GAMM|nr:TonB-dependent receptor [Thalassotalea algicola]NMP33403.1 TonB-dependent receptor [Thalassotalea algicola]